MRDQTDPSVTHAVVVGIERYDSGMAWNLNGPASDALSAVCWLRAAKVPPSQIVLIVDALESNQGSINEIAKQMGVVLRSSARRDDIMTIFTQETAKAAGEHLVIFWSGHGAVDDRGDRVLFTSDATQADKRNIRVSDLLLFLRDKAVRGFHRQIMMIDACANFVEDMRNKTTLTRASFPKSSRKQGVGQFVLYAAAQGQISGQNQSKRHGEFSKVVTTWLNGPAGARWPPHMPDLATHVSKHFQALREDGKSRQTPIYLWTQDWAGAEHERPYGGLPVSGAAQKASAGAGLTVSQLHRLVAALAECPMLEDALGRALLLKRLNIPMAGIEMVGNKRYNLQRLLNAVLEYKAIDRLFTALSNLARTEDEHLAIEKVKQRWRLQQRVAEPLRRFQGVTARQLMGYFDVVPDRQLAPQLEDLDEVLEYLAEFGGSRDSSPLMRFVARLERVTGTLIHDEWFELGKPELARLRRREAHALNAIARSHLVVDLRVSGSKRAWPAMVVGHLRGPDGRWDKNPILCSPTLLDAQQAVNSLIDWAHTLTAERGSATRTLALGFLLPRARFGDVPEGWMYDDGLTVACPIREEYPAVLHCGDRLTAQRAWSLWRGKAQTIAAGVELEIPRILWIEQSERDNPTKIRRRVEDGDASCVGFGFVPGRLTSNTREDPLVAAIAGGAPYLLWLDEEPADWDAARDGMTKLVRQGAFDQIPLRVQQLRRSENAERAFPGSAIRVLWDRPDWLPPIATLTGLDTRSGQS